MNKYKKWYTSITENAKTRTVSGYVERHHIIPRSLGGADTMDNLVDLTAREHFICHWLLTKIYTGDARYKMINALYLMQGKNQYQERYINSRVYETLRKEYAEYISKMNTGRVQPADEKARQIKAITGRKRAPFSAEWLAKIKKARQGEKNGMFGKKHSIETRAKQSEKATGRKQSDETVKKKADAVRGSKREKLLCPHCAQLISVNTYPRWHGDRCRHKPTS
jgi:hypothetical protein